MWLYRHGGNAPYCRQTGAGRNCRTLGKPLRYQHGDARFLAAEIPGAKLIEYSDCSDHLLFSGDLCSDIEAFVIGQRSEPIASSFEGVLAPVLLTDIVDSTLRASSLGDQGWRHILDEPDRTANKIVAQYRGRLIKTTGDGILATFDAPGRAIRCALALSAAVEHMGLQLRAGLHAGELETKEGDVAGVGVHAAARVMAQCKAGEVSGLAGGHRSGCLVLDFAFRARDV